MFKMDQNNECQSHQLSEIIKIRTQLKTVLMGKRNIIECGMGGKWILIIVLEGIVKGRQRRNGLQ